MEITKCHNGELAELLTLTVGVNSLGNRVYRNHLGQKHRVHGPAVITPGGHQLWYQNGMLHRTDGPALIWTDGGCEWWLNDEEFTEEEWNERINTTR